MSDRCICGGAQLSCDDVVFNQHGDTAVILGCVLCDDGNLRLKVELMRSVSQSAVAQTNVHVLWLACDVYLPTAWRLHDDCIVVITHHAIFTYLYYIAALPLIESAALPLIESGARHCRL